MNIADYYINGLPKIGTWRDMHMRIEGDAVNDLQEIFLTIWNKETKQNIGGEIYFPQHEDSTNIVVAIVDRTPKKNSRMLSHAYAMSIYSAQKKRTYRQSLFRADFFYQKSAQPDNRPGSERNNYGFVRLRHPFHAGCRTLQVA